MTDNQVHNINLFAIALNILTSKKDTKMIKIKFPSGKIGAIICRYMGMDDPTGHLLERPQIVQDMYNNNKCIPGKLAEYSSEEIGQLMKELVNAIDIKADHIDNDKGSSWTSLNQYQLVRFYNKLLALKPLI